MKFNQINTKIIPEIWDITSTIYSNFINYLKNNLSSILISYNYNYSHNTLNGDSFLNDFDINIQPVPKNKNQRDFYKHFVGIWTGVNYNPNRYYKVAFYFWIQLAPAYNKFYFDEFDQAKSLKQTLYSRGWEFLYVDNYWIIVKYFPIDKLNITTNEWIHQLDDFFAKACNEADELIFNTNKWGL